MMEYVKKKKKKSQILIISLRLFGKKQIWILCSGAAYGNTDSARSVTPLFQFHTLYKAEVKAL